MDDLGPHPDPLLAEVEGIKKETARRGVLHLADITRKLKVKSTFNSRINLKE
jgi:hypothetical protein